MGNFVFAAFSNRLQSKDETLAIFKISNLYFLIFSTEISSKGVHDVKNPLFFAKLRSFK